MLMSALSSKARALIEQAHEEVRPPVGEMERLEALINTQLGAPPPPLRVEPAPPPPVPRAGSWRLVTSLSVGAVLVSGAAIWLMRTAASQPHAVPTVSAAVEIKTPEPVAAVEPVVEAQAPATPEPAPSARPALEPRAAIQPARDALAQEVSLLSQATSNLRAGRAGAALKLLDEHQRKFPNGMLAVERRAVRAQALCTLKRVGEGRAELAQLAPQSPAAGRAKQLCDAASAAQK